MWGGVEFDILDEINIGTGTQLRLVQTHKGVKRIESWSTLSKQWNVMYRYGVEEAWAGWKKLAASIEADKAKKKAEKAPRKSTPKKTEAVTPLPKTKTPAKKPAAKPVEAPVKKTTTTRKKKND